MKTEGIIKYLKLQDSNLDFYKREIERLEHQITDMLSLKWEVTVRKYISVAVKLVIT